ncbi:MAG: DegV family protein [Stomatobaculum sp.]|nr:DegV family protein [Stomatobaculum sp.]
MNDYILTCCSTADEPRSFFEERGIEVIFFRWISDDGSVYIDDLGQSVPYRDFYDHMRKGMLPKTSQPNIQDFIDFFEPLLKDDKDVIHVSLASGISGAFNSASTAAETLREQYPERKITVIDSTTASSGYGLLMDGIWKQKQKGLSYDECVDWILENRIHAVTWFVPTSLNWLVKGGRVKPLAGFVGNILNICPVLYIAEDGTLGAHSKVRGKTKALQTLEKRMEALAYNGTEYSGECFISHSDCLEDAGRAAGYIRALFPKVKDPIRISDVGSVIGSHTGPGTIVLSFWGEKRIEEK